MGITRNSRCCVQNTYLTCTNAKLYQSIDTSSPTTVSHTAFLTTSKSTISQNVISDPFSDDTGDYVFIGISNKPYTDMDAYDITTFNAVTGGITAIGIGMSDGSGVGNKMINYHRRSSGFRHCTAVSNNTPITNPRSATHGGSDYTGFFMIWGRIMANNTIDLTQYRDNVGLSFQVSVTGSSSGSIRGTSIYTDDSPISVVVVHAGLLTIGQTGVVTITILAGQSSYTGTTNNSITSLSYSLAWPGSYRVS